MHIVPITPAKWIIHFIMSGITDLVAVLSYAILKRVAMGAAEY